MSFQRCLQTDARLDADWQDRQWRKATSVCLPVALVVNIVGCLVIGFLATLFTGPYLIREE